MELPYLDSLLTILRKHKVTTFKDDETGVLLQLQPEMPEFGADVSPEIEAGGWKRSPDLTE